MTPTLRDDMFQEDERLRAEVKELAYTCEEGRLEAELQRVMQESKRRQAALFAQHRPELQPTA